MAHLLRPRRLRRQVPTAGARGGGLQWLPDKVLPAGGHEQQAPPGGARQVCLRVPVAPCYAGIVRCGLLCLMLQPHTLLGVMGL